MQTAYNKKKRQRQNSVTSEITANPVCTRHSLLIKTFVQNQLQLNKKLILISQKNSNSYPNHNYDKSHSCWRCRTCILLILHSGVCDDVDRMLQFMRTVITMGNKGWRRSSEVIVKSITLSCGKYSRDVGEIGNQFSWLCVVNSTYGTIHFVQQIYL